ncbi:persephin [Chelydra serpentina]|uniref:Artemin n=2 Tax=Chelydra serpentina TaxID=8475 RepID=A0A8C3TD31_CHESE|nr:persephin [Chelydra serpentina]
MDSSQLLCSVSLILLVRPAVSQPVEGKRPMLTEEQERGTSIRDLLWALLETHLPKAPSLHVPDGPRNLLPYASPGPATRRQKRRPPAGSRLWEQPEEQECRLRSLLLRVKDLGLGYDSEETVLFKYCSGSCPKARTNHDLTLSVLLRKSEIPALGEEKIVGDPCCRPTHYEDVAFLDSSHQWHEVEKLSASACSCVG